MLTQVISRYRLYVTGMILNFRELVLARSPRFLPFFGVQVDLRLADLFYNMVFKVRSCVSDMPTLMCRLDPGLFVLQSLWHRALVY